MAQRSGALPRVLGWDRGDERLHGGAICEACHDEMHRALGEVPVQGRTHARLRAVAGDELQDAVPTRRRDRARLPWCDCGGAMAAAAIRGRTVALISRAGLDLAPRRW